MKKWIIHRPGAVSFHAQRLFCPVPFGNTLLLSTNQGLFSHKIFLSWSLQLKVKLSFSSEFLQHLALQ